MNFLQPTFLLSILLAVAVHEAAHAFVADRLGDSTARHQGRMTLNPIAHLDLFGTILFLLVGFGWGKPVPVDPRNFARPKRDQALVAFAGPVSNFLLAAISAIVLSFLAPDAMRHDAFSLLDVGAEESLLDVFLLRFLASFLFVNLGLMAFNLLPIAPLDGSKVLQAFIPLRYEYQYEDFMRRGPWILLFLLIAEDLFHLPFLSAWIGWVMNGALRILSVFL